MASSIHIFLFVEWVGPNRAGRGGTSVDLRVKINDVTTSTIHQVRRAHVVVLLGGLIELSDPTLRKWALVIVWAEIASRGCEFVVRLLGIGHDMDWQRGMI